MFIAAGRGVDVLVYPVSGAFVVTLLLGIYLLVHLVLITIFQANQTKLNNSNRKSVETTRVTCTPKKNSNGDPVYDDNGQLVIEKRDQIVVNMEEEIAISDTHHVVDDKSALVRCCNPMSIAGTGTERSKFFTTWDAVRALMLGCGLLNMLTLLIFTSASPYPMARWVDINFFTLILLGIISIFIFVFVSITGVCLNVFPRLRPTIVNLLNMVYVILCVLSIALSQQGLTQNDATALLFSRLFVFSMF